MPLRPCLIKAESDTHTHTLYLLRHSVGVVFAQVGVADQKVSVEIQVPELAVDDVEVFVAEVVSHPVDVLFVLQLL